jgi:uncharacterized protein
MHRSIKDLKVRFLLLTLFALIIASSPALAMDHAQKTIPWALLNGAKRSNEKTLLASKLSPNDQLIEAVSKNSTDQVASLLANGADANSTSKDEEPALIVAIENENESICKLLIAAGAEVNPKTAYYLNRESYWSPLTAAARIGDEQICKLLIESGANTDDFGIVDEFGCFVLADYTALWHAVYQGHINVVKLLLRHRAHKPTSTVMQLPLLPSIEMHKNFKELQELLNQHDIMLSMRTPKDQSDAEKLLLFSAGKGDIHFNALKKLLQLGADVNCTPAGNHNSTPLHCATRRSYYARKVTRLLLKSGANPNAQDNFLIAPLMYSSGIYDDGADKKTCKILLASGALTNLTDHKGKTALHYAAQCYDPEICQLLIDNGAPLDAQDHEGNTPLMISTEPFCKLEHAKMLLDAHPNMLAKNNNGNTALILAAQRQPTLGLMLIEYQMNQEKNIITLLLCLKNHEHAKAKDLYHLSKYLLRPYLKQYTVQALLEAKNNEGKCAYDYAQASWFNPNKDKGPQ